MRTRILKLILTGIIVGGAATWWWRSEHGKKTRENIQDSLEDFYDYLRPRIRKFKKHSYEELQNFFEGVAEEYGEIKSLSKEKIDGLVKNAWQYYKREGR